MAYGGGTFTSDQGSIQMETVGSNTLGRTGRCRITSIQAKGIATSTIVFYDSADASAPGSQVYVAKYGTEGLNTLIPGSGILFKNGIVYHLTGASGSVTVTITG